MYNKMERNVVDPLSLKAVMQTMLMARICIISLPAWGSNRSICVFSIINIIVIHQMCMSHASTRVWVKSRTVRKTIACIAWRSWVHFVCLYFCVCGRQGTDYSELALHGWWRHYMGGGLELWYLWFKSVGYTHYLRVTSWGRGHKRKVWGNMGSATLPPVRTK